MSRFTAAIFDMDGLLIDSEPLWQEAEISCFKPLGVPITVELCQATAGHRLDEVLRLWHERFGWKGPSPAEMHQRIMDEVTRLMMTRGTALPGVIEQMARLRSAGLKLAIASSSPPDLIAAVVDKLRLADYLTVTHSGTHEARGKPDPAVFLSTAKKLDAAPENCLVFEDAPAGVLAGHRAGMYVVAVPSVFAIDDPGFKCANMVIESLLDFDLDAVNKRLRA